MWQAFLFSLLIIAISLVFLCVRLFVGKRFVHTHVEGNKALGERGVRCAQSQDAAERSRNDKRVSERSKDRKSDAAKS